VKFKSAFKLVFYTFLFSLVILGASCAQRMDSILKADSSISGHIYDVSGNPVDKARVDVYEVVSHSSLSIAGGQPIASVYTQVDGSFTVGPLDEDKDYIVQASGLVGAVGVSLKVSTGADLVLTIKNTGILKGVVTLDGKTDHEGIEVYVPGTGYFGTTDISGNYKIYGVPEGSYSLYITAFGFLPQTIDSVVVKAKVENVIGAIVLAIDPDLPVITKGDTGPKGGNGAKGNDAVASVPSVSISQVSLTDTLTNFKISLSHTDNIYSLVIRKYSEQYSTKYEVVGEFLYANGVISGDAT